MDVQLGSLGTLLVKMLLNALALMVGAYFLKGVHIQDFTRALIIAIIVALLNSTLGSFFDFLTTPLRFLTLGLFSFVVDAVILLIAAHFMKGFKIDSFVSAFFLAIVLAITNGVLHWMFL
mgnify:CR=1 FL=1